MQNFINIIRDFIPKIGIIDLIEIIIMIFAFYKIILLIKDTKAYIFLKGLAMLAFIYLFSDIIGFYAIKTIFEKLFSAIVVLLIILFQQEIKKILGEIGKKGSLFQFRIKKKDDDNNNILTDNEIDSIISSVTEMSSCKTGALILIEKDLPLKQYSDTGILLNANISKQMLVQIFEKNTPLHDGAVIIHDHKIESATCYLPLSSNNNINKSMGTRHRAGIGITENSDCFVIIVSEETGKYSIAQNGQINYNVSEKVLKTKLKEFSSKNESEKTKKDISFSRKWKTKLFAIIAAFIAWLVIISSTDPIVTKTIQDINVTLTNTSVITDEGMSFAVEDGSKVDVTVKGHKSVIENVTKDNITAYADFNNISISNATEIKVNCNINGITAEPNKKMMNISIEDTKEIDYDITIKQTGSLSTDNYINKIELDKTSIKIKGPVSLIDTIDNVIAYVDITNASDNSQISTFPVLYDKYGNEINTDALTISDVYLKATVHMYNTKTVPLTVSIENTGDNGEITSYSYEKDSITIAAEDSILQSINGIFIEVPLNIDSSVLTSEFIKMININDFLQKDVYLAESNNKLGIDIKYEQYIERTAILTEDNIKFENTNKKLDYKLNENIIVAIYGKESDLNDLEINGTIDVENLEKGEYNLDIKIDNKHLVGNYKAKVIVGVK